MSPLPSDPFTGNEVDDAVIALWAAELATKVRLVEDRAAFERDPTNRVVIQGPFPYAVLRSAVGDDDNRRLSGQKTRLSVPLWFTYVAETHRQAKWAGAQIRFVLKDRRIAVPGHKTGLMSLQESQRIWRDDEAVNPLGKPLFYGVDSYAVSISITEFKGATA
jgi:hypothetical protein